MLTAIGWITLKTIIQSPEREKSNEFGNLLTLRLEPTSWSVFTCPVFDQWAWSFIQMLVVAIKSIL